MPESLEYFEKALKLNPERIDLYLKVGLHYATVGNIDRGIALLEKYIEKKPNDSLARDQMEKMRTLKKQRDFKNARGEYYSKELPNIRFKDEIAKNLFDKALRLVASNNVSGAIKMYESALSREPDHSTLYEKLGLAYSSINKYKKAIECCERALELDPDAMIALEHLHYLYTRINDKIKMENCMNRIRRAGSTYIKYLLQMGDKFMQDGNINIGMNYYLRIIALDGENQEVFKRFLMIKQQPSVLNRLDPKLKAIFMQWRR